jgi:hypothetical protein
VAQRVDNKEKRKEASGVLCVSAVRAKVRYLSTMNHLELDP